MLSYHLGWVNDFYWRFVPVFRPSKPLLMDKDCLFQVNRHYTKYVLRYFKLKNTQCGGEEASLYDFNILLSWHL